MNYTINQWLNEMICLYEMYAQHNSHPLDVPANIFKLDFSMTIQQFS